MTKYFQAFSCAFMAESTRVRLTRQGSAYLSGTSLALVVILPRSLTRLFFTDYARTINPNPLRTEKIAILAAIHAIPGNEAFTLAKLTNWFHRHRKEHAHPSSQPILVDDETIRASTRPHTPMPHSPAPQSFQNSPRYTSSNSACYTKN